MSKVVGVLVFKSLIVLSVLLNFVSTEWVDMSYSFDNQTVYWFGHQKYNRKLVHKEMKNGYYFSKYDISGNEHGGTHSDAVSHFCEGGLTIDQIPLKKFIGPAVVVNISEKASKNPDYRLSVKDLEDWESANGKIPNGAIVLMYSGWGKYWPNRRKFLNTATGNQSDAHLPGFHPDAAKWIVKSGKVSAVGVDTASLDYGQSKVYESHVVFCEGNVHGFEMVANLDKLPPSGATFYAIPMKTKGGSGGPTRIFAEKGNKEQCNTQRTNITWLDLTHSLVNGTVYWPGSTEFSLRSAWNANKTRDGFFLEMFVYTASEHSGTHLDSPAHFADGKWSTHEIPLDNLIGPAIKIDISEKAAKNSSYQLKPSDIEEWEKQHGKVAEGVILLVQTGWAKFWSDRSKYYGIKPGKNDSFNFPGIHPDAAKWMVKRKVKAVGLDTPSLDYGPSKDFETHQTLFKANIPGFQNVAHLDKLPVTGATVFAAPMKIKDGSGGPLRIFAKLGGECTTHSGASGVQGAASSQLMFFLMALFVYHITF